MIYWIKKANKKDDNNLKAEADDKIVFIAEHETLFWNLSQQKYENFIHKKQTHKRLKN